MSINANDRINMGWNFDNSYITLPAKFYTKQKPVPVTSPRIVFFNRPLSEALGLKTDMLNSDIGAEIFAGNFLPEGAEPIAQAYGGHQFGHFTMLGDGRAILIGEHLTPEGERYDIQLKGSGRTAYSRGGDGRAALGPMIREYIVSEALHNLGIPTTRSLAVVTTGEKVFRDKELDGAILTRMASSHIRVGTFQFAAIYGNMEELRELAEYTLKRHFSDMEAEKDRFLLMLREVIFRQAKLIAKWQMIGFIHGVMNTDNMTISGESIDFGPCAFMDAYDPGTVFSSIDIYGRYAYGKQPDIAIWNITRFAETLLPLIHDNQDKAVGIVTEELQKFYPIYKNLWVSGMKAKLGISGEDSDDIHIIEELLGLMHKHKADFTNTFKALSTDIFEDANLFTASEFLDWKSRWYKRLAKGNITKEESRQLMLDNNPSIIPRNHRVEEALHAATTKKDFGISKKLMAVLSNPYAYTSEQEEYSALPPVSSGAYKTFCGT